MKRADIIAKNSAIWWYWNIVQSIDKWISAYANKKKNKISTIPVLIVSAIVSLFSSPVRRVSRFFLTLLMYSGVPSKFLGKFSLSYFVFMLNMFCLKSLNTCCIITSVTEVKIVSPLTLLIKLPTGKDVHWISVNLSMLKIDIKHIQVIVLLFLLCLFLGY